MQQSKHMQKQKKNFPRSNNKFDQELMTPFFRQSMQINSRCFENLGCELQITKYFQNNGIEEIDEDGVQDYLLKILKNDKRKTQIQAPVAKLSLEDNPLSKRRMTTKILNETKTFNENNQLQ